MLKKLIILLFIPIGMYSQELQDYPVIDQIIAVIGDEILLQSEFDVQKSQAISQGMGNAPDLECLIMQNLLFEKLLLNQAKVDSVVVPESQIQSELDRRISIFTEQLGGKENLEAFYGKTIEQIKNDFHDVLEDQLLIRNIQATINDDVYITPEDVENAFNEIPKDSLPLIDAEVEIAQIVIKPEASKKEKQRVKDLLNSYRDEILNGKDFTTYAVLYSEDPGSASAGGELGLVGRGRMVKEFESVAFNLSEGEVSKVFETEFGYHIMQLIERRGDLFNARHILIKPKIDPSDMARAKSELDKIVKSINNDSITFAQAAFKFSEDEASRFSNGAIINATTGSVRFRMDEIDPQVFFTIDKMEVGEMSEPVIMQYPNGNQAYRIILLKQRSEPHRANLKDDYQLIQDLARNQLSERSVDEWIKSHLSNTYVNISEEYSNCNFDYKWVKSQ